jgi:tetratricopeptide (TPR) repeat protein
MEAGMGAAIMGVVTITMLLVTIYLVRRRGSMAGDPIMYHHYKQAGEFRIKSAREKGDLATVEGYLVTANRKFPYAAEAANHLTEFLIDAKRLDEAEMHVEKVYKRMKPFADPDNGHWYILNLNRVNIYLAKGEIDAAEAALNVAFQEMPGRRHLMRMRLTIAKRRGEDRDIIKTLTEIRDSFALEYEAHLDLFYNFMRLGMTDEAEACLLHAQRLLPRSIDVHIPLARAAHDRHDWELAAGRWADIQQKFVLNAEGFDKGAVALRHLGRHEEADAVLAEHPGHRAVPWPREQR